MILLLTAGTYRLIETKHQTKILYLDDTVYAWIEPTGIGEILVASHHKHKTDCVLATGEYRLYDVHGEKRVSNHEHLELEVGDDIWQGYLLLTGLPNHFKKRRRIIPTSEVITGVYYDHLSDITDVLTSGLQKAKGI